MDVGHPPIQLLNQYCEIGLPLLFDHWPRHDEGEGIATVSVIVPKYFWTIATVLLGVGLIRSFYFFRGRAMRVFATRSVFEYVGPEIPPYWLRNPPHLHIQPPVPVWISHLHPGDLRIRQVWNVMEGEINGVSVLIFDCMIGEIKTQLCTVIACQTEQDVFGKDAPVDSAIQSRITQSHGWTLLHGAWFMWFSWTMSVRRIDNHLDQLRGGALLKR